VPVLENISGMIHFIADKMKNAFSIFWKERDYVVNIWDKFKQSFKYINKFFNRFGKFRLILKYRV